jgi:hypothetical protein
VTTTVVVPSVTGLLDPLDNFAGRSLKRFGVGEVIDLSFASTPPRTADQLGGLRWFIDSGAGTLTGTAANDGTGRYTAAATSGTVRLALKVASGLSMGATAATKTITIVRPNNARMQKEPTSNLEHDTGTWGVYFLGEIFLRPKTVSFMFMEFREDGGPAVTAVASGYLISGNGKQHDVGDFLIVGPGNSARGSKVNTLDMVGGGPFPPPFSAGDFLWAIPWQFRVASSAPDTFTTANHIMTADAAGTATVEKKGAGPFRRVPSDPTSTF